MLFGIKKLRIISFYVFFLFSLFNSNHKKWSQFSDHITITVQSQSSNLICDNIVTTISDHISCGH